MVAFSFLFLMNVPCSLMFVRTEYACLGFFYGAISSAPKDVL